jgi:hypothetical protein
MRLAALPARRVVPVNSKVTVKASPYKDEAVSAAMQHQFENRWARPQEFSGESVWRQRPPMRGLCRPLADGA